VVGNDKPVAHPTRLITNPMALVWNFYFADDAADKQAATWQFFEQVRQGVYDIFVSEIVFKEIARASQKKRELLFGLISECQPEKLEINATALQLVNQYLHKVYFLPPPKPMLHTRRWQPSMNWKPSSVGI